MPSNKRTKRDQTRGVIAFVDLLGTGYYAKTDKNLYQEHLTQFRFALEEFAPIIAGSGEVYFFSDCAYIASDDSSRLLEYMSEIRSSLLPHHIYLQGAIQAGKLEPRPVNNNKVVHGTIFGSEVAGVYAAQDGLKGAAVRIVEPGIDAQLIRRFCVTSCHLPSSANPSPQCFQDLRYRDDEINRLTVENLLVDCMRAKAVGKSGGAYYISPLITMINSVRWSINVDADAREDERGARNLFDLIIRDDFVRHLGDLRGTYLVLYAMLNKAYEQNEGMSVCKQIQQYIVSKPSILERIDSVPQEILTYDHRRKFLESAVVWARKTPKKTGIKQPSAGSSK